jgi:enamine deaminase RidA (YjgF/YER057c/UK114 family)
MGRIEDRIAELGHTLPEPGPRALFALSVQAGGTLFTAGAGCATKGKLGRDLDVDSGRRAAEESGLQLLANVKDALGDLDKIARIVKVTCLVNSDPDFTDQPAVANGFTELMLGIFGQDVGRHARTAVGAVSLPGGIAVEIEAVISLADSTQPAE